MARRAGDPATRVALALDLLYARLCHGSLAAAVDAADEALSLSGDDMKMGADLVGYSPSMMNLAFSAFVLVQAGQLAEAERRLHRATQLADAETAPETLSWLSYPRIELELFRGNSRELMQAARRGLELAERSGSRFDAIAGRCWLGQAQAAAGYWSEAVGTLEDAAAQSREQRTALDMVIIESWALPTAYLGLGDINHARTLADEAVQWCRAQRARIALARVHFVRAAIIARADPRASSGQASADLDAAEQLITQTGAEGLRPQLHEGRASLASGTERKRLLREAHRLYVEMGASGHAARLAEEVAL